jgi:uroporphyrinogen decarboxylase
MLACELTLQPIRKFALDAAIIFSDILVIPQAMGMEIEMKPKVGPVFTDPLNDPSDIEKKLKKDVNIKSDLSYVYEAITLTRHNLEGKVPLIGFSGAPWTLFAYMVEGGGSKTMSKAKRWLYQFPDESFKLLNQLADYIIEYLVEQVRAGAQLLQLFESHCGYLTPNLFEQFALPVLQKISKGLRAQLVKEHLEMVPLIVFAKDGHFALKHLGNKEYFDVVSCDWSVSAAYARSQIDSKVSLQGNLDPCALYADADTIDYFAEQLIKEFGCKGYIANLGHGIYPDMKPESVNTFVNAIHKYSKKKL